MGLDMVSGAGADAVGDEAGAVGAGVSDSDGEV